MKFIYTFFIMVFFVPLSLLVDTQSTGNEFGYALNNLSTETGESLTSITQSVPSIGDALTTSSSISNTSPSHEKGFINSTNKINEYLDNVTQSVPSIGDALTTSSSISNQTKS